MVLMLQLPGQARCPVPHGMARWGGLKWLWWALCARLAQAASLPRPGV